MFANLPFFLEHECKAPIGQSAGSDDVDEGLLRGRAAFEKMWEKLAKTKDAPLDSLKLLDTFRHLLPEDEFVKLDEKIQSFFKGAAKSRKFIDQAAPAAKRRKVMQKKQTEATLSELADTLLYGDGAE